MEVKCDRATIILQKVVRILSSIFCILVVIYQFAICDFFYVTHYGKAWLGWIVADILVIVFFIISFVNSFRSVIEHLFFFSTNILSSFVLY